MGVEPALSSEHELCELDEALGLLKYETNKDALTALHEKLAR